MSGRPHHNFTRKFSQKKPRQTYKVNHFNKYKKRNSELYQQRQVIKEAEKQVELHPEFKNIAYPTTEEEYENILSKVYSDKSYPDWNDISTIQIPNSQKAKWSIKYRGNNFFKLLFLTLHLMNIFKVNPPKNETIQPYKNIFSRIKKPSWKTFR